MLYSLPEGKGKDLTDHKALCEKVILPIIAEKMGFEPEFELEIVPKVLFDVGFSKKSPERNPELCYGLVVKKKTIFVKEEPLLIPFAFIHELMHIYYQIKEGESYMRYEERVYFLSIAIFYGIMIYRLGKEEALELIDSIAKVHGDFKLTC